MPARRVVVPLRIQRGAVLYEVDAVVWLEGKRAVRVDALFDGVEVLLELEEEAAAVEAAKELAV